MSIACTKIKIPTINHFSDLNQQLMNNQLFFLVIREQIHLGNISGVELALVRICNSEKAISQYIFHRNATKTIQIPFFINRIT